MDWKDIVVRAGKTGAQAAITLVAANGAAWFSGVSNRTALKAAIVSAALAVGSAFVAAAWNVITQALAPASDASEDGGNI